VHQVADVMHHVADLMLRFGDVVHQVADVIRHVADVMLRFGDGGTEELSN